MAWDDTSLGLRFAFCEAGHLFMYLLVICKSLRKISTEILCSFVNRLFGFFFFFLLLSFISLLYILDINPLYGLQIFSPIPQVAFSFCQLLPLLCRSFILWCNLIWLLCFCCLCFWCHIQQITAQTNFRVLTPCPPSFPLGVLTNCKLIVIYSVT